MADRRVVVDLLLRAGPFSRQLKGAAGDVRLFGSAVDDVGSKLTGLGVVAAGAGAAIVGAAGAVGAAGVKEFLPLEATLSRIEGLVGVNRDQLDAWADQLTNDLPRATGQGPAELADALFFVTSAGIEGAAAMDTLDKAARAATAGLGETKIVADVATSAINAYGLANVDAGKAVDVLVATVREGKAEAPELAGALGRVIPIAASLGVEFEEVGGAVAVMTRSGLNADEAVTALRGTLNALLDPTVQARDALAAVGLTVEDVRANLADRGLLDTLRTLETRLGGDSEALAKVFGNVRALTGVLTILNTEAGAVDDVFRGVADSAGSLDTAFGAVADDGGFALQQFQAELSGILAETGERILPQLTDALRENKDEIFEAVSALGDLAVALVDLGASVAPAAADIAGGLADMADSFRIGKLRIRKEQQELANDLDTLFGPFINFPDFTPAEQELLSFLEASRFVGEQLAKDVDPIRAVGAALAVLAERGDLTSLNLTRLQEDFGLTAAEMGAAAEAGAMLAAEQGISAETTQHLLDVTLRYRRALEDETFAAMIAAEAEHDRARFAGLAASATEEATEATVASLTPLEMFTAHLRAADDAQRGLAASLKAAASPVFAAIDAYDRYQRTLERVDEDGERSAAEQAELAAAVLDTQAAFDQIDTGDLNSAILAISTALEISEDAARDLLEQLGVLDGTQVTTVINVEERLRTVFEGRSRSGITLTPLAAGGDFDALQPLLVGERGPEIIVPAVGGTVLSNSATQAVMNATPRAVLYFTGNTFGATRSEVRAGVAEALITAGIAEDVILDGAGV